jgi:hypothetical protein
MWARDSSVAAQAVPVVPLSTLIYSFITLKKILNFHARGTVTVKQIPADMLMRSF